MPLSCRLSRGFSLALFLNLSFAVLSGLHLLSVGLEPTGLIPCLNERELVLVVRFSSHDVFFLVSMLLNILFQLFELFIGDAVPAIKSIFHDKTQLYHVFVLCFSVFLALDLGLLQHIPAILLVVYEALWIESDVLDLVVELLLE